MLFPGCIRAHFDRLPRLTKTKHYDAAKCSVHDVKEQYRAKLTNYQTEKVGRPKANPAAPAGTAGSLLSNSDRIARQIVKSLMRRTMMMMLLRSALVASGAPVPRFGCA